MSFTHILKEHGFKAIIIVVAIYCIVAFSGYLTDKGAVGYEGSATMQPQYSGGVVPSASMSPDDLLPKDTNAQWASLNPTGKGEIANIGLLKAGQHIGLNTVGQSRRNGNLQVRSEEPNPQLNVGPWNQSTITPDFMRPPFEINSGGL